ncbi:Fe(3+) dicitrate transport ATP-binding protein FecE [uncultured delta proteobacterium]|uniref:Fe(3+) dicitrate transport ATP-binding protein FecE n=1 Tax=uncultured delta proteobacterium TaxID=34034 RepID=A0A212JT17_9DELT|nr:Fe(3+) dicitrate transport ATP-binding protein FecE [uncultured delta proteobacterium]
MGTDHSVTPHSGPYALSVENVRFRYGVKDVLRDISFAVPRGNICGLFGPNGSGKTTLFRCCLGLLAPQSGTILLEGHDVARLGIAHLARHMAYVPQEHKTGFPFLVREVVAMGRTPHMSGFFRLSKKDMAIVEKALDLVGITELANEPCTALSGGQRQLVSLARALAQEAPLMLLDEPTSALDFSNQMVVWQALRRIAGQGVTVLVCCHDPNHILWFCDEVAVLHQGRVAAAGKSRETLTAALLRMLYGTDIEVCAVDGRPLVRPAGGD